MPTDTTEAGMESRVVGLLRAAGYAEGRSDDHDRANAVDVPRLLAFLQATQAEAVAALRLDVPGLPRKQFLNRLKNEITKRGVIDVLLKGVQHNAADITLFHGTPTAGNDRAIADFQANTFSVTRQLRYSARSPNLALDLVIFLNGLPIITFELKNQLTKQTVADAIRQYRRDRSPREPLFAPGRCVVHFAVDDAEVRFCTELKGAESWFLPFNKGHDDGAGNPPDKNGLKTDYLWTETLTPSSLVDILENYARRVVERDPRTNRKTVKHLFPRYHQLRAVRRLLAHAEASGPGQRYLIQHSAGSGKSYSITWLTHQLIELDRAGAPVFDTVFVITDRRALDKQIPRRDQAVRPGQRGGGRGDRGLGPAQGVHPGGQANHHVDCLQIPLHPGGDRGRPQTPQLRHRDRRGALQPGRQGRGGDEHGHRGA